MKAIKINIQINTQYEDITPVSFFVASEHLKVSAPAFHVGDVLRRVTASLHIY